MAPAELPEHPARILLAEDSRFLRRATELILAKAGYEIITAADGIESLNVARMVSPALIILDLMMPKMNGLEVLQALKQDAATSSIPVVILTGLSQKNDLQLLEAGAAAYYEKTKLIPEALVDIVRNTLENNKRVRRQSEPTDNEAKSESANSLAFTHESNAAGQESLHAAQLTLEENQGRRKQKESDYENELLDQIISLNNELASAQQALAKANEELRRIAETDSLTGVPNRRKALYEIDKLLALARRQRATVSFAILDLDNFKTVNDTHGHSAGDNVLQNFGQFLAKSLRTEDAVGRWGGEEFIVALYGCSLDDALARLNQLREQFSEKPFVSEAGVFHVTFSGGVASFPQRGATVEPVYEAADKALYRAKKQGRNRILSELLTNDEQIPQGGRVPEHSWRATFLGTATEASQKN